MTDVRSLYLTFETVEEAERLAEALLERRLIACANVLPGVRSLYRWRGDVVRDEEVAMIVKTTADRLGEALRVVDELHPYDVPCAVAWPVDAGLPAYLAWVHEETRPGDEG